MTLSNLFIYIPFLPFQRKNKIQEKHIHQIREKKQGFVSSAHTIKDLISMQTPISKNKKMHKRVIFMKSKHRNSQLAPLIT